MFYLGKFFSWDFFLMGQNHMARAYSTVIVLAFSQITFESSVHGLYFSAFKIKQGMKIMINESRCFNRFKQFVFHMRACLSKWDSFLSVIFHMILKHPSRIKPRSVPSCPVVLWWRAFLQPHVIMHILIPNLKVYVINQSNKSFLQ